MSDIVVGIIQGYLDTFKEYKISEPALKEELDLLKKEMLTFAEANRDPMSFYGKFSESGLQEKYTNLIGRIAMAAMTVDVISNEETSVEDSKEMSVKDYLEQYRIAYEEVKKSGTRKRAEKAYENLFDLADRTEDMLDAQLIIEEERLLWHIVKEDNIDISETTLKKLDPLQPVTTITMEEQLKIYKKAESIEELDYLLEKAEYEKIKLLSHEKSKMIMVINIARLLFAYANSKHNVQITGGKGKRGEDALRTMIASKSALKTSLNLLEKNFSMNFDDLLSKEGLKIWLLNPQNVDEFGRTKTALNPQNYEAYREIVYEEILTDLPIIDLLKRERETVIYYGI